ncbi:hypothetical protein Ahy_A08g039115 [Arachis hypogaea]|uniref:Aminotransferase-like plant mobile domain-containing protein n=1 Tax=Arachis hypogaea TaxID=3818 RepID=A0A445BV99_ARAHY|nr:hypothetical protein Ahy_A08g039115 [Arachis hypogaea]
MAGSSSQNTTQDKGKGHEILSPSPPALRILNQVNDEVIDDPQLSSKDTRMLIPVTIGAETHCFLGPIESQEKANKKLSFFPSAKGKDLGYDFTAWYRRLESTKSADWRSSGIHELLKLSHFALTTHPWMIGAVTCFWNRTTNNFYLLCGMIRMSLLDVAAITGLPISSPDYTPNMQPKRQYNVVLTTSYNDFIAHNMGAEDFDNSQLNFTPFLRRNRGPAWLDRLLFPDTSEANELANQIWTNILALQQRRDRFNFMIYKHCFYITKSCFEWWAAYYSRYTRTLEEIQQAMIRTTPVAESSPKRTQKRKAETARPPPSKSRRTPTRTFRKLVLLTSSESADDSESINKDTIAISSPSEEAADSDPGSRLVLRSRLFQPVNVAQSATAGILNPSILPQPQEETIRLETTSPNDQAAFTEENQAVPDSDSASKAADTTNSDSSRSKVLETPAKLQLDPSHQTPPKPRPRTSNVPTTPTSATLEDLTSEQLRSLIKLLDHPPTTWVNDPLLNQILADVLKFSFEFPTNTPFSASIQEFKSLINESVASHFQLQETENEKAIAK